MKKFMLVVMVIMLVLLTGCGNEPERNYCWTDLETGVQYHGLTREEYYRLENWWEDPNRTESYHDLEVAWDKTTSEQLEGEW